MHLSRFLRAGIRGTGGLLRVSKVSPILHKVGAALLAASLGWGFSLVPLEKQGSGHRFPLGSFVQVEAGGVGVTRLPWVLVGAELLPGARKELPPGTSSPALQSLLPGLRCSSAHCFGAAASGG